MKEIKEIIAAYEQAVARGEQTALATVVKVDGSSYRRPGARMLVTESGALTGAISGGCLEGDALKKAQLVMYRNQSMIVTYDTTDDDDAKFGVGLGCNGIIHILIEPIDSSKLNHPISLLKQAYEIRKNQVIVTLFDLENKRDPQRGTCILTDSQKWVTDGESITGEEEIKRGIRAVFDQQRSIICQYGPRQAAHAFVEWIPPHLTLVVAGAGNDVQPLARIADVLGWDLIIMDGRASLATPERFPTANAIHIGQPDDLASLIPKDSRTAVILMTHNFNYDFAMLENLIPLSVGYLGVLGPKKKLQKLIENLTTKGIYLSAEDHRKIYGPVGLNLGAEAPEEIALSIVSEVKAALSSADASFLRDKAGPIHEDEGRKMFS